VAKQQQGTQDPGDDAGSPQPGGKGRPTPKRREAEAANRRPLVPTDRKAAAKTDKTRQREERMKAQQAMMAGDERYLPARDRGPIRRFVRDVIDARWNVAEFFLPASFVIVLAVLFSGNRPQLALASIFTLYLLVFVSIGDALVASRQVKKRVLAKFGTYPKGTTMYAILRAFQIRGTRVPRPRVKRREYPS
jgi:hypothetical protein